MQRHATAILDARQDRIVLSDNDSLWGTDHVLYLLLKPCVMWVWIFLHIFIVTLRATMENIGLWSLMKGNMNGDYKLSVNKPLYSVTKIASVTQYSFCIIMLKRFNIYELDYPFSCECSVLAKRLRPHSVLIGCDFDWFCGLFCMK